MQFAPSEPSDSDLFTRVREWLWLKPRTLRIGLAALLAATALVFILFIDLYLKLTPAMDRLLSQGPFSSTVDIYSAPERISTGDVMKIDEFTAAMKRSGYTVTPASKSNVLEVRTGPRDGRVRVEFVSGIISRMVSLPDERPLPSLDLRPQLMTNLSDRRERRRLVNFDGFPRTLVDAVVSAEDKRFFRHSGFDLLRMVKAALIDFKSGRKQQGASTLSMQLARNLWLEPDKRWRRKLQEVLITMHMERRLSKQQIFEYYANQVYLGQQGTFSINGFAEGARAYFGKDVHEITPAEAALLAGMVQRPSYYNPYRYPERARSRRDLILRMMYENGYLDDAAYRKAVASPLRVDGREHARTDQSQYFIDLARAEAQSKLAGVGGRRRKIYTSLDPRLQEAAEAAVRSGMAKVDRILHTRNGQPQVALVALDPRTGAVKALVGGRDYGTSQFNHATAMRQPGSVFKPFVYTAAVNTALERSSNVFTPASIVSDEPITFFSGGRLYQPDNFHHVYMGDVTMHTALIHSLNAATLSLAEKVGFGQVVQMARLAGLNEAIQPTPAVALGAYESTPLEIAGAYTAFANGGIRVAPWMIEQVRAADDRVLYQQTPEKNVAFDPRVTFLMVKMLEDVLNRGTAAGVRAMGFRQPAAGKTGTSRDGWFAGFTSELLCVVWVGFDDNRDLGLEGSRSALPIWGEFMKRAANYRPYRDATTFQTPAGIESVSICADSGKLAGPRCPRPVMEVFISGTAPTERCKLHEGGGPVTEDEGTE